MLPVGLCQWVVGRTTSHDGEIGIITKKKRRIAIVAFADGWEDALKSGAELWGFNNVRTGFTPADAALWFQLHSMEYLKKSYSRWINEDMPFWLEYWRKGGKTKMYTHASYPELIGAIPFPVEQINQELPLGWYHCSSMDWMVAFALLDSTIKEIALYGIDFSTGGEPLSARPCLEYWCGVAMGRGVKINNHSPDLFSNYQLLRTHRQYAWDYLQHTYDCIGYEKELEGK